MTDHSGSGRTRPRHPRRSALPYPGYAALPDRSKRPTIGQRQGTRGVEPFPDRNQPPLCTIETMAKTGEFTIMIALVEGNTPILGVIAHPIKNSIYVAQKGQGAYRLIPEKKWNQLHVNNTDDLTNCRAVGSRFHRSDSEKNFFSTLNLKKFDSRGSSLKVLDISSGDAELYYTFTNKIKQWDTCASACLIKEAGGKITDMKGNELKYNQENVNHQNGILVTNGIIHETILNKYKNFSNTLD